MTTPLAIEGRGGSSSLIDALAYVDPMSAQEKQAAEALIDEEVQVMRRSGKRTEQYIAHLPPISSFLQFKNNERLRGEMERIRNGQRHMQPLDLSATSMGTPRLSQQEDLSAWQACASNAAAQVEHQHNRVTNLKLSVKHGGALWRAHNAHTDVLLKHCNKHLQDVSHRITKVNQRRKLQQEKAKAEMDRLQSLYRDALKRNIEIEEACQWLEQEINDSKAVEEPPQVSTGPPDTEQGNEELHVEDGDGSDGGKNGKGSGKNAGNEQRGDDGNGGSIKQQNSEVAMDACDG